MSCKKVKYSDEIAALIVLARLRNRGKHGHTEKRAYFCKKCNAWHLTSRAGSVKQTTARRGT